MEQQITDLEKPDRGISLYVHIPFCKTKCPYCDFNTYQGIEALMGPYMEALLLEIRLWGATLGHPRVNTIFFRRRHALLHTPGAYGKGPSHH